MAIRLKENQSISKQTEIELSATFKKATLAEIKRATVGLERKIREEFGIEKEALVTLQNQLLAREAEIQELKRDFNSAQDSVNLKHSKLENAVVSVADSPKDFEKPQKNPQRRQVKASKQKSKKSAEPIPA
jgi:hypothetical protein